MANTKIGEQGLKHQDIEERNRLIQKLIDAFSKIEESVNSYQENVDEINGWLDEMRDKFDVYSTERSEEWKESKDGASSIYTDFQDEWKELDRLEGFESTLEKMRESMDDWLSDLKNLPKNPKRRTKRQEIKLFRREL